MKIDCPTTTNVQHFANIFSIAMKDVQATLAGVEPAIFGILCGSPRFTNALSIGPQDLRGTMMSVFSEYLRTSNTNLVGKFRQTWISCTCTKLSYPAWWDNSHNQEYHFVKKESLMIHDFVRLFQNKTSDNFVLTMRKSRTQNETSSHDFQSNTQDMEGWKGSTLHVAFF